MYHIKHLHQKNSLIDCSKNEYAVLQIKERLEIQFPKRETILSPWLLESSLNMIHAWRGVGKTHVSLGIAYAVASAGSFFKWQATKSKKVLYIDGEMPGQVLNERLENILNSPEQKKCPNDTFWIFGIDLHNKIMPDLGTKEGQDIVDRYINSIGDIKLVIIDNLSCLLRSGGRENDAESWKRISGWALQKRAQGLSIIFVHHSGKDGTQRGTSKKEDILDTVISLRHPYDYSPSEGARFEVHFEKCRHLCGEDVKPFIASLTEKNNNYQWQTIALVESNKKQAIQMHKAGCSNKEIASELGISRQAVYKHLKNLSKLS